MNKNAFDLLLDVLKKSKAAPAQIVEVRPASQGVANSSPPKSVPPATLPSAPQATGPPAGDGLPKSINVLLARVRANPRRKNSVCVQNPELCDSG